MLRLDPTLMTLTALATTCAVAAVQFAYRYFYPKTDSRERIASLENDLLSAELSRDHFAGESDRAKTMVNKLANETDDLRRKLGQVMDGSIQFAKQVGAEHTALRNENDALRAEISNLKRTDWLFAESADAGLN